MNFRKHKKELIAALGLCIAFTAMRTGSADGLRAVTPAARPVPAAVVVENAAPRPVPETRTAEPRTAETPAAEPRTVETPAMERAIFATELQTEMRAQKPVGVSTGVAAMVGM